MSDTPKSEPITLTPCQTNLKRVFASDALVTNSSGAYDEFVSKFCLREMDIRVPNGCKPSVCFHSGFWLLN